MHLSGGADASAGGRRLHFPDEGVGGFDDWGHDRDDLGVCRTHERFLNHRGTDY